MHPSASSSSVVSGLKNTHSPEVVRIIKMSSTSFSYKKREANAFLLLNGETGMKVGGIVQWRLVEETGKAVYILCTRKKALQPTARDNSDT